MAHVQGRALRLRLRAGWCSSPRGRQAGPRGRDVTAPRAARCRPGGQRSVLDPGLSIQSPRFAGDVSPLCSTSASARSGPAAPPRARGLRLGPCTASRGHGAGDLALDDPLWGSSWRQCRPARTGHAASPATPGAAPRGHSPGDAAQLAHMLAVRSALFPPTAFPLVSDILEARHRQMRSPSAAAAENAGVIARGLRKKQKRHLRQLPKRGQ
ncbi:unnamed protein product [Prorocentrum cordatum]|uniref:Uncharacterized protein n=1 Tax=Prorocentrum cordatum TaxID=2364126 RepID=A0ABN9XRS2_9DINO|nr:unnamed protein product [Polarella glacialis]